MQTALPKHVQTFIRRWTKRTKKTDTCASGQESPNNLIEMLFNLYKQWMFSGKVYREPFNMKLLEKFTEIDKDLFIQVLKEKAKKPDRKYKFWYSIDEIPTLTGAAVAMNALMCSELNKELEQRQKQQLAAKYYEAASNLCRHFHNKIYI